MFYILLIFFFSMAQRRIEAEKLWEILEVMDRNIQILEAAIQDHVHDAQGFALTRPFDREIKNVSWTDLNEAFPEIAALQSFSPQTIARPKDIYPNVKGPHCHCGKSHNNPPIQD